MSGAKNETHILTKINLNVLYSVFSILNDQLLNQC